MKKLFSLPHFVDEPNRNRIARLLHSLLWSTIGIITVYATSLIVFAEPLELQRLSLALAPLPLLFVVLWLLHKGYVYLCGNLFVGLLWVLLVASAAVAGGVNAPGYSGLVIPIFLSSILLRRKDAIWIALLSILAGYLLLVANANEVLVQRVYNTDSWIWITQAMFFVMVVLIADLAAKNREKMVAMMSESKLALLEVNRHLKAEVAAKTSAEEELRFQAHILDQVSDAIIATDQDTLLQYWNLGAESLYGLTSEQVLGKRVFDVLQPNLNDEDEQARYTTILEEGYWEGQDHTHVLANGKEVFVESRIRHLKGPDEQLSTVIVSSRDIHLHKKAEEALTYRTQLQQLVTELAIRFINPAKDMMNEDFVEALRMVSDFFDVDRGVVALLDDNASRLSATYEYCRPGLLPLSDLHRDGPPEHFDWVLEQLRDGKIVNIDDISQLPSHLEPVKVRFHRLKIKSVIDVPLIHHGELIGFLGFSTHTARTWTDDVVNQLTVLGQIIVNSLERRQYEVQTQKQSAQLDVWAQHLSALRDLDQAIFASRSLNAISELALSNLQRLSKCKCSSIFLLTDEEKGYFFSRLPKTAKDSEEPPFNDHVELASIDFLSELRDGMILLNDNLESRERDSYHYKMALEMGVKSAVHIPLMNRSELIGILHLGFDDADGASHTNIDLLENVASSLSLAIANTQLYDKVQAYAVELEEMVTKRTEALERQYRLQAALAEIELAINQPVELQRVLDQVVRVTAETLPADIGVSVVLWDPQEEMYHISATSVKGQMSGDTAQGVRKQGGATRWIIEHKKQLLVEDTQEDPFGANRMITEYGVGSYAGYPLLIHEQAAGVLYALRSEKNIFTKEELDFMEAVTSRASLAIAKVRLFEQAKIIAAEEERQRIARELHDVVSQSLFSASVIAESLPRLFDHNPELVNEGLHDLQQLTKGTLAEMRTLLFELRPDALEEADLDELLQQLTVAITGRTQIPISLRVDSSIDLPPSQQIGIYRITQEALNNVSRHSQAKQVKIELKDSSRGYTLSICDDGKGFEPSRVPSGHFGLQIIRERASGMGADVVIKSRPGKGTCIEVSRSYN